MEVGYVFKVKDDGSSKLDDMLFKGEGTVKSYSKIADMRGGRLNGVVNIETEVLSGFSEGLGAYVYNV